MDPAPASAFASGPLRATDAGWHDMLAQLERGVPPWLIPEWLAGIGAVPPAAPVEHGGIDQALIELFAATGMDSAYGPPRTFYSFTSDRMYMADWRCCDPGDFARDWIHELVHATGHPSRLGRDMPLVFGSTAHGVEDLVAEIGAAIVCTALGLAPALRHPDAVPLWIALLRVDGPMAGEALRQARAAADYLFALRDARRAAADRFEAGEALAARAEAARLAAGRRLGRRQERERWTLRCATVKRPGESLLAGRPGDRS
jgi:Zincin-like metallopeptidase